MIQTFKILTGKNRVDKDELLPRSHTLRTRGHSLKLAKQQSRLNVRKYSFGVRVVNEWNSLPEWVVSAKDLNDFKNKLDRHWSDRQFLIRPTHAGVSLRGRHERELQV